jgi:hypothetical protein
LRLITTLPLPARPLRVFFNKLINYAHTYYNRNRKKATTKNQQQQQQQQQNNIEVQ